MKKRPSQAKFSNCFKTMPEQLMIMINVCYIDGINGISRNPVFPEILATLIVHTYTKTLSIGEDGN